jgi:hypothetical protein
MTRGDLGSRTDLEALSRAGRFKFVVLGLLLVGALGLAAWSFLRKTGTGNPEDPRKVIVVTTGTHVGYSIALQEAGFDGAEGTFNAWENKAKSEVPDLEETGVAAIMALADRFGYAFVAFERPQDVDFSGLDIDGGVPTFEEHVRFAVLTAGDLSFPHVVATNPVPSKVMRSNTLILLQALFAQPRLAQLLDPANADIDDIQLADQLREGLDRVKQVPEAELMASKIVDQIRQQLVDEERAEPKPALVAEPLESGSAFPLHNGGLLTISRSFDLVTRDAVRADLHLAEEERILFGQPGGEPGARVACESLAGGKLSVHDSARFGASIDGGAVLLKTLSEGLVLWALEPGESCAFRRVGEVPSPSAGVEGDANPHASGKVARTGVAGGFAVIEVATAGTQERVQLAMLDHGGTFGDAVWLDAVHLAAVSAHPSGVGDAIYIVSLDEPTRVLVVPAPTFDGTDDLGQVAHLPGAKAMLAVTAGGFPRRLFALELPGTWAEMFATPPNVVAPTERTGLPTLYEIDMTKMAARALTREGRVLDPVVAPDGRFAAFELTDVELDDHPEHKGDTEIAAVEIATGRLKLLTRNALRDADPRFTQDGKHVVLETRVEIPKTDWTVTAPRIVAVD